MNFGHDTNQFFCDSFAPENGRNHLQSNCLNTPNHISHNQPHLANLYHQFDLSQLSQLNSSLLNHDLLINNAFCIPNDPQIQRQFLEAAGQVPIFSEQDYLRYMF